MKMRDATRSQLLDEINEKHQRIRMSSALACLGLFIGVSAGLAFGPGGWAALALALPAYGIGGWLDYFRRVAVVYYDLDDDLNASYEHLTRCADDLARCAGIWHIEAAGAVRDLTTWKRNAGATSLIRRTTAKIGFNLPTVLRCNVTPPALRLGRKTLYFLPDITLVEDGDKLGAVGYPELKIAWADSRFIEEATVPSDAQVVGRTWQHPNKNGGPDRRFKNKRELPICLYETAHLTSNSGLNELIELSKRGVIASFADALRALADVVTPRKKTSKALMK